MDYQQLTLPEKHIKNAWIAGSISASVTFIVSMIGAYNESVRLKYGFDTWSLLDVALIAGLTYGIYKKNRFCALGMLIYFIISKFIMAAESGRFAGGVISILFAYFFFQGTRAAFQIHKHRIESGEIVKKVKKKSVGLYVGISLGSIIGIGLLVLLIIGAFSPEIEVIPGKQVNKKYMDFIRENNLIDHTEAVQYWYSDAFGDFKDCFYLFTDKKVVIYNQTWEEPAITISMSQIADIQFDKDDSFFDDSRITLLLDDHTSVFFPVSSENGGDIKYFNRLVEVWSNNQNKLN
jgi:hypothetical protein